MKKTFCHCEHQPKADAKQPRPIKIILSGLLHRRFRLLLAMTFFVLLFSSPSLAQVSSPQITCTPLAQFAKDKTHLECRLRASANPTFLLAEVNFPFRVTELISVSSNYSASLGALYPASVTKDTVLITALQYGDQVNSPSLQAIPFEQLTIVLTTDQSMAEIKKLAPDKKVIISLLSPNPADSTYPFFQTISADMKLTFDGSLILESITQYVSPGILQFLRFALACYEQTPQACLSNVLQNL